MRKGFSHWVFITLIFTSISTHANSSNGSNFETFGDITQVAIPLSGAFIAYFKNDEQGLVQLAEGALYTSLTTHTLKHLIEAKRPDGGDLNSFPSGHTSAAFQGAAFLHFRYGWKYGLPAYAFASAVGASSRCPKTLLARCCYRSRFSYWYSVSGDRKGILNL